MVAKQLLHWVWAFNNVRELWNWCFLCTDYFTNCQLLSETDNGNIISSYHSPSSKVEKENHHCFKTKITFFWLSCCIISYLFFGHWSFDFNFSSYFSLFPLKQCFPLTFCYSLSGNGANSPVVEEFGSFVMDIFNEKSDIDLSINFSNSIEVTRQKKIETLRKFSSKLRSLQSKLSTSSTFIVSFYWAESSVAHIAYSRILFMKSYVL